MKLTQKYLKSILRYSKGTGVFTWVKNTGNKHFVGKRAGGLQKGYYRISINNFHYTASRLAWFYVTGKWPKYSIDHINGDPADDRWKNLRDIPQKLNMQNRRVPCRNSSNKYLGITRNGSGYLGQIVLNGKYHYLGTYRTQEQAHAAYLSAKRRLHKGCTI